MTGIESAEQFDYLIQALVHQSDLAECKKLQDSLKQAALQSKGFIEQEIHYRRLDNCLVECNVRLRFSDVQACLAWIDSPIRRHLLNQAEANFVHQFQSRVHKPSFDLWLASQQPNPPPIWKMNLLVWLALYPSVMLLSMISVDSLGAIAIAPQHVDQHCNYRSSYRMGSCSIAGQGLWGMVANTITPLQSGRMRFDSCPVDGVLCDF